MAIKSMSDTASSFGEFNLFRDFIEESCGIALGENKQYLVNSRIKRILLDHDIVSLNTLVGRLRSGDRQLKELVVDAMTTNETFWFRDNYPYDYLKNTILPHLNQSAERGEICIWSAACSSGQEPHSISMIAQEYRQRNVSVVRPLKIIATDLSSTVLKQARSGMYDRLSVLRGLSKDRLNLFFTEESKNNWQVKPEISQCIDFRPLNLMDNYYNLGLGFTSEVHNLNG